MSFISLTQDNSTFGIIFSCSVKLLPNGFNMIVIDTPTYAPISNADIDIALREQWRKRVPHIKSKDNINRILEHGNAYRRYGAIAYGILASHLRQLYQHAVFRWWLKW